MHNTTLLAKDDRPFEYVFKFPDISGPIVFIKEALLRFG